MVAELDTSYTLEAALKRLGVRMQAAELDDVAWMLSLLVRGEPVSVRDPGTSPVRHSRVYRWGKWTGARAHLEKLGM